MATKRTKKILIVDNNDQALLTLQKVLENVGFDMGARAAVRICCVPGFRQQQALGHPILKISVIKRVSEWFTARHFTRATHGHM